MLPPKKLYKIGEVIRYSGVNRQTLHNYTLLGLIRPEETTLAGHRLYPESVFDRLDKIKRYKLHRKMTEVKDLLDRLDAGEKKA